MKHIKKLIFIIILFCSQVYDMTLNGAAAPAAAAQASAIDAVAPVKTFLLPKDKEEAKRELISLLDSASSEVLIAMYWLTEPDIIDKIIDLRRRINVQIIFDESTPNKEGLIDTLMRNDIIPIVFLSKELAEYETLMHNKFLVIDRSKVWTGSANFTKKALDPGSIQFNHENILLIYSGAIARKFIEGFETAKIDAFDIFIALLANPTPSPGSNLSKKIQLSRHYYQTDPDFRIAIQKELPGLDPIRKERLRSHFSDLEENI